MTKDMEGRLRDAISRRMRRSPKRVIGVPFAKPVEEKAPPPAFTPEEEERVIELVARLHCTTTEAMQMVKAYVAPAPVDGKAGVGTGESPPAMDDMDARIRRAAGRK